MAFCGQCGQLLNTNTTRCPHCGTQADFDAATPGVSADENAATIIAHTENPQPGYTPIPRSPEMPSLGTTKAGYYTASERNASPGQRPSHPGNLQDGNSYPTPGAFDPGFPSGNNTYNVTPQGSNPGSAQGMYQPGAFPITDPGYPPPTPQHKTHRGLIFIIIVLLVALLAATGLLFALGSNQLAGLFGAKNTPIAQAPPTAQPAATAPQNTTPPAATQPAPTQQATPTVEQTQQAQATIQQYYININNQNYQAAYNLWVSNPDNYDNFKQGFAHTHHDTITLGNAIAQTDGTIQVYLTVQATEDATPTGTQISTYQGYYTVGQQADGSWKIINGQLG